jgi:hypothetical protein
MSTKTVEFPTVALIEGALAKDGQQVLLQLSTLEHGSIQFSLRVADMESFVTFLLRMVASVRVPDPVEDRIRYQPIPITGVTAGELADGMGCLGVTIGGMELMFQIPTAALSEVAHTLLMVGFDERAQQPS